MRRNLYYYTLQSRDAFATILGHYLLNTLSSYHYDEVNIAYSPKGEDRLQDIYFRE